MSKYHVFRTVACPAATPVIYHTLMISTDFQDAAIAFARKCHSPVEDTTYIQSMTVIGPTGEVIVDVPASYEGKE